MQVRIGTLIFAVIACMTFMRAQDGYCDSTSDLIRQGNAAYNKGEFDKAIAAYNESSINAPESPYIYFNKGAAFYKMGDYDAAIEAFEKAALKSKDSALEAKSKFNLGNCFYRDAERQEDSDLNKAIENCTKSIQYYQEALTLDPGFKEAAQNIEVVRLVMKDILDKINKQKEEARQQQEKEEKTAEKLKELIKKQKDALNRNHVLADDKKEKGDSPEWKKKVRDLENNQRDLKEQTVDLAKSLSEPDGAKSSSTENPAKKHLENASKDQEAAAGNLGQYNQPESITNQEKAIAELEAAMDSMAKDQNQSGKNQDEKQSQGRSQAQDQKQQPNSSPEEKPQQGKDQKENDPASIAQLSDDARDILQQEKENKKQRQVQSSGGYKAVEKDW